MRSAEGVKESSSEAVEDLVRHDADGAIPYKIERAAAGFQPRVLDLFSGCGGISLGFQRSGAVIVGGVENNQKAALTHAANFHSHLRNDEERQRFEHLARARMIEDTAPGCLLADFGVVDSSGGDPRMSVDILVGGPPCQAYARIGRAKLREVRDHPYAYAIDARGSLYAHYIRFVAVLQPLALLLENVPDILNYKKKNVAEEIAENLSELGYCSAYALLNAAGYGVPQTRERWYLLAWRRELSRTPPRFPPPTHCLLGLPKGYKTTRSIAQRLAAEVRAARAEGRPDPNHCDPLDYHDVGELPEPVTAREAMADLPAIYSQGNGGGIRGGKKPFDVLLPYRSPAHSAYASMMRSGWPGFANPIEGVRDHVTRYLPRDFRIFAEMGPGDEYPAAHTIALRLFTAAVSDLDRRGVAPEENSPEWAALRKSFVPPYRVDTFPNKWRKLHPDRPTRTLMAHLSRDSYSHIHYSDRQARTITVREAARLQSFPDGFLFQGPMNPAFRMIGNAVPPLMAYALADSLLTQIRSKARRRTAAAG